LVDERKANATTKAKTSHEGKNKNLRTAEVSLDNADTVIEGGPHPDLGVPYISKRCGRKAVFGKGITL